MKENKQHILHQVNVEINTNDETKAFEIKNQIDDFLKEELFPNIELLFDKSITPEEIRRFESIDLEVQMHSSDHLVVIKDQLISQLHAKIDQARIEFDRFNESMRSENISEKPTNFDHSQTKMASNDQFSNLKNTFLYFLETGQLPWHASPETLSEFTQPNRFNAAFQDKYFLLKLKQLLSSKQNALKRFIHQFDDEIITGLIDQFSKESKHSFEKLLIQISGQIQAVKELLYILIINRLIQQDYQITSEKWQQLQNQILKESQSPATIKKRSNEIQEILSLANFDLRKFNIEGETINPELDSKRDDQTPASKKEEKTNPEPASTDKNTDLNLVYIRNAGLILAHPFLRTLFTRTGCTDEKGNLLSEKQIYAIHLLHYLSTGGEQGMEHELTFEKFLCGIPLDKPINRKVELSDQDKLECNDLLKSMISNWSALKNTSQEGLRQTFIQRNGKLDLQKLPNKLYVERKTLDILLDNLPWNISMVKLPWMKEILFVEW